MNETAGSAGNKVKQALHRRVEEMPDDEACDFLDYLNMLADPDTLTDEEMERADKAEAEMRAGNYVALRELDQKYGFGASPTRP